MSQIINQEARLRGLLLGTAVGDSLGLPAEGLNSRRTWKFFHGKWRHRFILRHGMVSDDTEHTLFVAQALISSSGSSTSFRRALAWRLRLWLLCLPAGIGFATLRSILKLWLGISPEKSGVYSAGNGAAMRSAIIGAYFFTNRESIDEFVKASTLLTHTDPRALTGALAVAHIAAWVCRNKHSLLQVEEIFTLLHGVGDDNEWQEILSLMRQAYAQNLSVQDFAAKIGLSKGVTGYVYHTVPVAIYGWMRHYGDFEKTLIEVLNCGGDTDTVGAIAGALAGVTVGENEIPKDWVKRIIDFPVSKSLLRKLGHQIAIQKQGAKKIPKEVLFWISLLPRNLLFLLVIFIHAFRRFLPPY